eukprot:scaffold249306_cov73-Cyclotella_meneghiniana.AAC.7
MGFAEQLALKAAERTSRESSSVASGNSLASGSNKSLTNSSSQTKKKKIRPRIQPVSDEEFAARMNADENSHTDEKKVHPVRGEMMSGSFTDQLKQKSANNSVTSSSANQVDTQLDGSNSRVTVVPVAVQIQRAREVEGQTNKSTPSSDYRRSPQDNISILGMKQNQNAATISKPPEITTYIDMQQTWSHQIQSLHEIDPQERLRQHSLLKMPGGESGRQMPQVLPGAKMMHQMLKAKQPNTAMQPDAAKMMHQMLKDTKSVAQAGHMQRVVPDAELMHQMLKASHQSTLQLDPTPSNDLCASSHFERQSKTSEFGGISSNTDREGANDYDDGYVGDLNVGDHDTVSNKWDAESHSNNLGNITDVELVKWKQRALQAEKQASGDYSTLISPHSTSTSVTFQSPPKQRILTSSEMESDLIKLKNHEIKVLRNQIAQLELRVQEECARSAEILQSIHHNEPPIAVLEDCSTSAFTHDRLSSNHQYEFRMLRNEIRHLQYQLGQKRSTQSTTGSTLSSLENEHEEDEDEENEEQQSSSWGLCCVRRSRKGYGRVQKR